MTHYIRATAEHTISEGKINEFKKLAAEIIDQVDARESNTISYEWFLNEDESKCYVVGVYKDSKAVLDHLGIISDLVSPFHEIAPLTGLRIFGNPTDELKRDLEPFDVEFFEHWNGVTR